MLGDVVGDLRHLFACAAVDAAAGLRVLEDGFQHFTVDVELDLIGSAVSHSNGTRTVVALEVVELRLRGSRRAVDAVQDPEARLSQA